jgi:protease IV
MKKQKKNKKSILEIIILTGKVMSAIISVIFILIIIFFFLAIFQKGGETEKGNVALIQINGIITATGESYIGKTTKSDDIIKLIDDAEKDSKILAILFEINSPGGSPVATDEISSKIKSIKKPTASLIRETGASGGFWIATAAEKVFANRMSITGSIGATSSKLAFPNLIKEYNITYRRLVAGEHKDAGSIWKEMSEKEKEMFEEKLNFIHEEFIKAIAENRKMEISEVKKHSDGFIFTGKDAYDFGFVDELGNKEDVRKYFEEKLNTKVEFKNLKTKKGLAEIFGGVMSEQSYKIGEGISSNLLQEDSKVII